MLFCSVVAGAFAAALALQFAGCHQLSQSTLHGTDAERRAKLPDVLFGKPSDLILCRKPHRFKRGSFGFHQRKAIFKIPVGREDRPK